MTGKGPASSGMGVRLVVSVGMWAAMAAVLMLSISLPLMPSAPYLRYEPSDVPVLLGGAALGPGAAVLIALIKDLIYLMLRAKGPFGPAADFVAAATFGSTAGVTLRWLSRSRGRGLSRWAFGVSLLTGVVARTLIMLPASVVILHLQFGYSAARTWAMFGPVIAPFNLIKGGVNGAIALALYAALWGRLPFLHRSV